MKNVIDKNIKIVKFIGATIYKDLVKLDKSSKFYNPINDSYTDELEFHKDWNILMLVVEYIETIDLSKYSYTWKTTDINENETIENNFCGICVDIEMNKCWIYTENQLDPCTTMNENTLKSYPTKIEAVYESILDFIDYHNSIIIK